VNPDALDLIRRYLEHLSQERRLSALTAASYRRDLAAFAAFCASQAIGDWSRVDSQHVRSFASLEHRRGLTPRSIQRRLSALRSFFRYLAREQVVGSNPGTGVTAPRARKRLPATLDADQMARLLDFRATADLDARDKAVMELLYSSGLRLAELVSLDLPDLDLADRTVRVTGKGRKTRIVPVGEHAARALRSWLGERTTFAAIDATAVFVGRYGRRLGGRAVQKRIDRWAKLQGIGVRVHPHMFRHSFASHLLESSGDLRGVQELLGHANIATTQVYTHLDFQHLARIYDAAHPRAKRRKGA
jgi:integrase/recombinase XerC